MNKVVLFGAGRGIAALLLDEIQYDHQMILVIRHPEQAEKLTKRGFKVIHGDATDQKIVEQACQEAGPGATVISTLGGEHSHYEAHRLIIDSAEKFGLTRMLLVTSIGCGDSWPTLSKAAKLAFGHVVREKSLAESWLQTSQLDYAIIRPGGLQEGKATGKAKLYQEEVHGLVKRHDVALLMARLLRSKTFNQQIYAVIDPTISFKRS